MGSNVSFDGEEVTVVVLFAVGLKVTSRGGARGDWIRVLC